MATTNETARGGKTQTLTELLEQMGFCPSNLQSATQDQQLVALVTSVQKLSCNDRFVFMAESWDWIVALQWMQDHGMFKTNLTRPPFSAFKAWLHHHNVPQTRTCCSLRSLTHVNQKIAGAHFPWRDIHWESNVLQRWRVMYQLMDRIWSTLTEHV